MNKNLSRNNHYLSQMYLEAWKNKNGQVELYELLVPNDNAPQWKSKPIKSVGSFDSIFVRLKSGEETDDIEKWFNEKYETPAKTALSHAINDEKITVDEWHCLIDFLACHIVRSPAFIIEKLCNVEMYNDSFQKATYEMAEKFPKMQKEDFIKERKFFELTQNGKYNDELFPLKLTNLGSLDEDNALIKVETIVGKQLCLWAIKYLLENTAKVLHEHKWSILTVDERVSLPTSDNPVVILNYYDENNYNFAGGWDSKNTYIIFPISPQKVLFTQIGVKSAPRINLDYHMSLLLKKIIVEHSYRKVISNFKDEDVIKIKPRIVSETEFRIEKQMWPDFQKNYLEKEAGYIK
mgnify:CR=1 FL=1